MAARQGTHKTCPRRSEASSHTHRQRVNMSVNARMCALIEFIASKMHPSSYQPWQHVPITVGSPDGPLRATGEPCSPTAPTSRTTTTLASIARRPLHAFGTRLRALARALPASDPAASESVPGRQVSHYDASRKRALLGAAIRAATCAWGRCTVEDHCRRSVPAGLQTCDPHTCVTRARMLMSMPGRVGHA